MKRLHVMPVVAAAFALTSTAAFAGTPIVRTDPTLYPDAPFAMNAAGMSQLGTKSANDDAARLRATSNDPEVRCSALESQFDHSIDAHATAKKAAAAKALRREGAELCASGKPVNGIRKLEQALRDINVMPYRAKG